MSSSSSTAYPGKRICQVVKLRPEHEPEYLRLHRETPSAVLEKLREYHIEDYSIHYYKEAGLLIATFKYLGDDLEADSAKMREEKVNLDWWEVTDGMQQTLLDATDGSHDPRGWWLNLEEVFRFEK